MLLSYSIDVRSDCGVDIHMISSLRGGVSVVFVSPIVVPPITASSGVVALPRGKLECLEKSLTFLGELGCHLQA